MQRYYSKLLLFGEYLIIRGGRALAIPYPKFGGQWQFDPGNTQAQQSLPQWADYLDQLSNEGKLLCQLDISHFRNDLSKGLHFESDIPVGYGLGSSGALCAALYDEYSIEKIDGQDTSRLPELRKILAQLENFFHGSSSGIDPLIGYLNRGVIIREDNSIEVLQQSGIPENLPLFLLDTNTPRKTSPLVQHFLQNCEDETYLRQIDGPLHTASTAAINAFVHNQQATLATQMTNISTLQKDLFEAMIPAPQMALWQQGLTSGDFSLKLCGAGGGGFFLGYAHNRQATEKVLAGEKWMWV